MFSRRGLLSLLPAFLVPKAWSKPVIETIPYDPTAETGVSQEQLRALACSLPLPELKKLIENWDKLEVPERYPESSKEYKKNYAKEYTNYFFPSGEISDLPRSETEKMIAHHEFLKNTSPKVNLNDSRS